jgi:hypothetical protein
VAFTDHYYAGLFGSPSIVASHANVIGRTIPETAAYVDRIGSPMLIGEFNVVLEKCGGDAMMRRYYDEFASRGWMATMWSYKLLKPTAGVESDNWYMVTNADALPAIDVRTSSLEQIEKYMSELATMPLAVDEKLRTALTERVAPPMPLPDLDPLPQSVPRARSAGDWKLIDVETDITAGVSESPGGLSIVSAGSDIFTSRDSFSFLQQNAPTNAMVTATLNDLLNSDGYAKAGLMIRFGTLGSAEYPSAPFAMIHAFPDGGLAFTVRDRAGGGSTETKRIVGPLPRRLAMVRDHSRVDAYFHDGNAWIKAGSAEFNQAGPEAQIGVAVCSHHGGLLTRAQVRDLVLVQGSAFAGNIADRSNPTGPRGRNLLRNPSIVAGRCRRSSRRNNRAAPLGLDIFEGPQAEEIYGGICQCAGCDCAERAFRIADQRGTQDRCERNAASREPRIPQARGSDESWGHDGAGAQAHARFHADE